MKKAHKLQLLRKVRDILAETHRPTLRECGLKQQEAVLLSKEGLVEFYFTSDEGEDLDRYRVEKLTPTATRMLIEDEHAPESVWSRIAHVTSIKLWDLAKVAFGAVIGWLLKSYFG